MPGHSNVLRAVPLSKFQTLSSPVHEEVTRFGDSSMSTHARISLLCAGREGGTCRVEITRFVFSSSKKVSLRSHPVAMMYLVSAPFVHTIPAPHTL